MRRRPGAGTRSNGLPPWLHAEAGAPRVHSGRVRDVAIREDEIRLGQLLKLAGLADSGAGAKALLATGEVTVNGEPEERRGRRLRRGDVVAAGAETVRVA